AMFGKAVGLQLTWRFDEATEIYQRVLSTNEDAEEPLINLVTIGIARKDIQTIRSYSERLIQVRPNSQTALEGLATCAFADEDYEAAARYCETLVEATPNHFERAFNLGVAN